MDIRPIVATELNEITELLVHAFDAVLDTVLAGIAARSAGRGCAPVLA